jgi:hypothetical protein
MRYAHAPSSLAFQTLRTYPSVDRRLCAPMDTLDALCLAPVPYGMGHPTGRAYAIGVAQCEDFVRLLRTVGYVMRRERRPKSPKA